MKTHWFFNILVHTAVSQLYYETLRFLVQFGFVLASKIGEVPIETQRVKSDDLTLCVWRALCLQKSSLRCSPKGEPELE